MLLALLFLKISSSMNTTPRIFFSGVDHADHLALLHQEQAAAMINARSACQPTLLRAYRTYPSVPIVLDSGAYQGCTDVAAYRDVIETVGERCVWVANLDRIGDPILSQRHFESLFATLSSEHLRSKVLWIYQHGSLSELADVARRRKHIGVGGMIPIMKRKGVERTWRILRTIGEVLQEAQATAHVFGIGNKYLLSQLHHEPWFASADSSKWLIGYRAQAVIRADRGDSCHASKLGLRLSRKECSVNNVRVMAEWVRPASPVDQLTLPFSEVAMSEDNRCFLEA